GSTYYYRISANDNAGNESNKTSDVTSMPHVTDGDYSLSFDGTDDYVQVGNNSELSGMSTLSVQVWVRKTTNPSSGSIISKWGSGSSNGSNYSYSIYEVDGSDLISFFIKTTSGTASTSFDSNELTLNLWRHIVGVYDGSDIKIYLNGTLVNTSASAASGSILTTSEPVLLGKDYSGNNFNGSVDEVSIWNDALTAAEIAALFNSGNPLTATSNSGNYTSAANVKGYWRFGENT
ncbi:uncharacterized protein METZ01_LOCUS502772, partial [marine metagenome]